MQDTRWSRRFAIIGLLDTKQEDLAEAMPFLHRRSKWDPEMEGGTTLPHRILPYLYIGDYLSMSNPIVYDYLGVKRVVNLAALPNRIPRDGVKVLRIDVADTKDTDISVHFEQCLDFIEEGHRAGESILINCGAGISRSGAVLLAYLMGRAGMTLRDAYIHARGIRPIVQPNASFVRQLIRYEAKLFGHNSVQIAHEFISFSGLHDLIRREMELGGQAIDSSLSTILAD